MFPMPFLNTFPNPSQASELELTLPIDRNRLVGDLKNYHNLNQEQRERVQDSLALAMGFPAGYTAALFYSAGKGAIDVAGNIRGMIRERDSRNETGQGSKFVLSEKELSSSDEKINFSFDVGLGTANLDSSQRAIIAAIAKTSRFVDIEVFYSGNQSSVVVCKTHTVVQEAIDPGDNRREMFSSLALYKDRSLVGEELLGSVVDDRKFYEESSLTTFKRDVRVGDNKIEYTVRLESSDNGTRVNFEDVSLNGSRLNSLPINSR